MPLLIEIRNGTGVIRPAGSLDASAVAGWRTEVGTWWDAQPELRKVVVDLAEVSFLDSSGLGALLGLLRRVTERGGEVVLARPRPAVKLVFEITRTYRVLNVTDALPPGTEAPAGGA